jgi:hydroxymethylpyrimidine pyrophosphatase-like HAD family hydrolase
MVYFIDVDGTLTETPDKAWGKPFLGRIEAIRELIKTNIVVIWSGRGYEYAKAFCDHYGLQPFSIVPKPDRVIDDNLEIRPGGLKVTTYV